MAAIDGKILLTKSDCYKSNRKMIPKGIVVHSTGAANKTLKRYIAPDDGYIGKNEYGNDWNRSGLDKCVHAFIGVDKNGLVKTYQTLPFDICCWGCGAGSRGSYNYNPSYIQFEMCEDDYTKHPDKEYCKKVYSKAVSLCAYLCKKYKIEPKNIVSHKEASTKGYASNHGDPHEWWGKYGLTMNGFRKDVTKKMKESTKKNILDKKGLKKGKKTSGVLALKELLIIARKKGIIKTKVDENSSFGSGTEKAVNEVLKKGGYDQNGIAGMKFMKYLAKLINSKI